MKVVVRLLILFICFITIQSEAQRGWRLFDQFGGGDAIHESSASHPLGGRQCWLVSFLFYSFNSFAESY